MAAQGGLVFHAKEPKEPKNKYNLTEDEIVYLSTLKPKQKKAFLKMSKDERASALYDHEAAMYDEADKVNDVKYEGRAENE